jgi:hypothetical protein
MSDLKKAWAILGLCGLLIAAAALIDFMSNEIVRLSHDMAYLRDQHERAISRLRTATMIIGSSKVCRAAIPLKNEVCSLCSFMGEDGDPDGCWAMCTKPVSQVKAEFQKLLNREDELIKAMKERNE